MSNSLPGRDGGPFQNLEKPIPRSATMAALSAVTITPLMTGACHG